MRINKLWGHELILVNEPEYCAKELHILPGAASSLHYHNVKKETFIVRSGFVFLEQGNVREYLSPGDLRTILPKTPHRFSSDEGAILIEVSMHHSDEDVFRLEPSHA